jgi:hypothetical protein
MPTLPVSQTKRRVAKPEVLMVDDNDDEMKEQHEEPEIAPPSPPQQTEQSGEAHLHSASPLSVQ